jgi:hypothetical protein
MLTIALAAVLDIHFMFMHFDIPRTIKLSAYVRAK